LERIKGFDVALHMLALLKAEGIRVQLKIAGTGPEETHLRKLAGNLDLEECIDFVGPVPYARMPEFYRSLDLYLQPSVEVMHDASGAPQAESMGRGLCEAQSCGIPVVASRSGGIPDVIRDGISGLLVQPGEPRELAAAVGTLLRSLERRMEFAAAGRAFAVSRLSWKGVVDSTEAELEAAQAVRPQP
jgi:glycosyltransferase involved in cell wall biosynthesis